MIVAALLFITLGILIKYAKMYWLIAGYNTMSKEEQEKYDIEGIATVFRNVMFGMAFVIIVGYFMANYTKSPSVQDYAFWTSIAIGMPYLFIKSNSEKFKL
ncbi:MAG: DUF3784 domain-containing protein [Flavobacterium sp.]|uniref:DUF3784 domain-containing protein n=1 Tax=Flavobacterium sp. TaxID=239 RepID=UPI0022C09CF6|nr:DUF3784 domain-containing protein [Flavobacterium sp.]MCZ8296776.1 DUF3784 domain-containing protein [Flavobacterium sp.]